jgi:small subunit ribosomal protein S1
VGKHLVICQKKESGLGVITNFKEKFSIGLELEVLIIKEQNADGMVTVSARALILRQSWEKVSSSAKNGELINVLINGFNRGGLTCDVDGLRGFIPRSQLEDGQDYQSFVGKTLMRPCVVLLALPVNVNLELRKTQGRW